MNSKALADKLVAKGYAIKGPSSTVDEDVADTIRKTVLRQANVELAEKPIAADRGQAPVQRRTTVIRRRPKTAPEEVAAEQPKAGDEEERPVPGAAIPSMERSEKESLIQKAVETSPAEADQEKQAERIAEHGDEKDAPHVILTPTSERETEMREAEAPIRTEDAGETPETEAAESPAFETKQFFPERKPKKEKEKEVEKKLPARKGLARVVGTIAIPVEDDQSSQRFKKKVARTGPAGKVAGEQPVAAVVTPVTEDSARGKKKGKRAPGAVEEEDDRRQGKGAGKKGKKGVKFTHFGADYQAPRGSGKKGRRDKGRDKTMPPAAEMKASKRRIKVFETISVAELASRMKVKASEVIAKLMSLGVMATMNQAVDVDTAMLIATDFGYEVEQGITEEIGIQMFEEAEEGGEMQPRSPVVTVMGHVDHGKTSILDAIRKTDVAVGEAGGITQHIGAYHVRSSAGDVTFVDTPGHAAFTEMRSRGAQITDLVILVVAADDGVMDQTREAINHAQAAGVPILVAVNKIDKPNADIDRVKRELSDLNLAPEDWGGQTVYCETSAKKNIGIDNLMESIQLVAEMLELKADPTRKAKGRVVEAQLDKGRGAVATVLVQEGTLNRGDHFVVGQFSGKVRAMLDDKGRPIKKAGPSIPVEVQGLSGVPSAGDEFLVVTDEKMAKSVSSARALKAREMELGATSKISLDKLFEKMNEGEVQELRVIIRADVQGTLEAFAKAAEELSTKDIKVKVLHEGTGTITESDILLASASEAIIIGFNVRPTVKVKDLAVRENVDVRSYDVIYHALDDIRNAMVGMLEPTFKEDVIGNAEIREIFHVPKIGTIAGCSVTDGKIQRNASVRVLREGVVIFTGKIASLRRFKDDVKEVLTGYECGIGVENFNDLKIGDNLEAFVLREVEATLE
ncbi:translation initiation factor IF-2 [Desulfoprunum benzoelyticum]|uniref:Translation initiation factor IF-2 n=2 Tax=Desulfoprunum benzoelyticum TaxID=1506996 RepID=A0A840UPS9_9BACT|nr:translation initiation factor IF-2 [Desulfoprunum benzoelyticum]